MQAGGRKAEDDIARLHIVFRQNLSAFDRADGEAREIVILARIKPRHFRGLAADQSGAGLAAALGDAGDNARGKIGIEPARRIIIEKEERLRALDDEIVDAHGDEIDADRRIQSAVDGELDLGSDAVIGGDKDRILESGGLEIEKPAKAADFGIGARPSRRPHQRLDFLDQRIARIDIDAGLRIGERLSCDPSFLTNGAAPRERAEMPDLRGAVTARACPGKRRPSFLQRGSCCLRQMT